MFRVATLFVLLLLIPARALGTKRNHSRRRPAQ